MMGWSRVTGSTSVVNSECWPCRVRSNLDIMDAPFYPKTSRGQRCLKVRPFVMWVLVLELYLSPLRGPINIFPLRFKISLNRWKKRKWCVSDCNLHSGSSKAGLHSAVVQRASRGSGCWTGPLRTHELSTTSACCGSRCLLRSFLPLPSSDVDSLTI